MKIVSTHRTLSVPVMLASVTALIVLGYTVPASSQTVCDAGISYDTAKFTCSVVIPDGMATAGAIGLNHDPAGNLFWTTGPNVKVADPSGTVIATLDSTGIGNAFQADIAFDGSGNAYLGDFNANNPNGESFDGAIFRCPGPFSGTVSITATCTVLARGFPDRTAITVGDPGFGLAFPASNNVSAGFISGSLYVGNPSPGCPGGHCSGSGYSSGIFRIDNPTGSPSAPSTSVVLNTFVYDVNPIVDVIDLEFGPGGTFGDQLYVLDANFCDVAGFGSNECATIPGFPDGAIFTVDASGNTTLFKGAGSGMFHPQDLAFAPAGPFGGLLYVDDTGNGRILTYDASAAASTFASGFISSSAITFGPDGSLYVRDRGTSGTTTVDYIIRFDPVEMTGVGIDVKPGSDPNCFNINDHGSIPVAILGSDTFDVLDIDTSTILFAGLEVFVRGKKGPQCNGEDVNDDGILDLVCHFEDDASNWEPDDDSSATLAGKLSDGSEFEGSDSICVRP